MKTGHLLLLGVISIAWSMLLHKKLMGQPSILLSESLLDQPNGASGVPNNVTNVGVAVTTDNNNNLQPNLKEGAESVNSKQQVKSTNIDIETILIIATVPYTSEHVMALWSQLECLTDGIDRVHISAPDTDWSRTIVEAVIKEFQRLSDNSNKLKIEASYHTNNRYDAGLWCDGLRTLGFDGQGFSEKDATTKTKSSSRPRAIFLINDSTVAIRKYNSLTDRVVKSAQIEQPQSNTTTTTYGNTIAKGTNLKLVSLNGNLVQPGETKNYWVESVYRGLTPLGIYNFYHHTCTREAGRACVGLTGNGKKRCVVNRYEMSLADSFKPQEVDAMYPTYLPKEWDATSWTSQNEKGGIGPTDQWIRGRRYFRYLVAVHDFPMRKIKWPHGQPAPPTSQCLELLGGDRHGGGKNAKFLMEGLRYPSEEVFGKFQEEMLKSESTL